MIEGLLVSDNRVIFLSHASEDSDFAVLLADALRAMGRPVWLDLDSLTSPGPLPTSLNEAIRESHYAVALLSPRYLAKAWTIKELDAFTEREVVEKRTLLVGVLHGLSHSDLVKMRPTEGSRRLLSTSRGASQLATEIVKALSHIEGKHESPPWEQPSAPSYPDRLVGRDADMIAIDRLLDAGRLVTLWGPPGVGKTRLAAESSGRLARRYVDGCLWVSASTCRDAAALHSAVANALGVWTLNTAGMVERLVDALRSRSLLLVLDNLEQIPDASEAVAELVRRCPALKVLCTSQRRLRLREEVVHQVMPLAPDSTSMAHESRSLFLERSASLDASTLTEDELDAIDRLCEVLGGLPLAIELAAARTDLLTPSEMLERLLGHLSIADESPSAMDRHRSVNETLDWSYSLLSQPARRALLGLSVCVGGFTRSAAERLLGLVDQATPPIKMLAELLDSSLLRRVVSADATDSRYELLEPVRLFAIGILRADAVEYARWHSQCASYFLELAREAEGHFGGRSARTWLDRLERDHANLTAGLEWLITQKASESLDYAIALFQFWNLHGHIREGRRLTEAALEVTTPLTPADRRATALNRVASFARLQGDHQEANRDYRRARRLAVRSSDSWDVAYACNGIGLVFLDRDMVELAKCWFERSLEVRRREPRLEGGIGVSLGNLGDVAALFEDDVPGAKVLYGEAVTRQLARGDLAGRPVTELRLAWCAAVEGDVVEARRLLYSASVGLRDLADLKSWAQAQFVGAQVALAEDDPRQAAIMFGAGHAIATKIGIVPSPAAKRQLPRLEAELKARLGRSFGDAHQSGLAMSNAQAMEMLIGYSGAP